MRTRTGLMLAVALCTLSCEEDEQLLGLKSPARAPGADAAVASTSTVQGVEAGVRDSGLPNGHADAALLDASTQPGSPAQGPQFEGGITPNEDARATTPGVGQGAPGGTQEVPVGAADREPDGGVASIATSGAGGAPGVALIGPDSGANTGGNPGGVSPPATTAPGAQTLPTETALPEGWSHQLPAGCSTPSPIDIGGFVQNAIGCPGYLLSATCFLDADDWLCSGLVMDDSSSPGGAAVDPAEPPPYPTGTGINYRLTGVASGVEASNLTLAVTALGERWPLQSDVCVAETRVDDTECYSSPGCAHLVDSDSGVVSLWRPTGAGARCTFGDPTLCYCSGAKQPIWEAFVSGVDTADVCDVAEAWCNEEPRQKNTTNASCGLYSDGADGASCRYESYCGGSRSLPGGGEIRPVGFHAVSCEPTEGSQWDCTCERPDGILRWAAEPSASRDACSLGVDTCNAAEPPEALALPTCVANSQQSDTAGCRANFDCTWPASLDGTEAQGFAVSALSCSRSSETSWRCLCGTTGDAWNFDLRDDSWDSCVAAVEQCAARIASGEIAP